MSPDLIVRPGVDAHLELDLLDSEGKPRSFTGWTATLIVRARHGAPAVYEAELRHRPGRVVVDIPGDSIDWTFGVGRYEVWFSGHGRLDVPHQGRVLVDRR